MSTYLEYLNTHPVAIDPGQPVEIVPFAPRYAEACARCYHQVYRDTFPVRHVYEPARIIEQAAREDLLSTLAVTPKGEVVGLTSAFHFGPNRRAWEVGGTMVVEAYRKGDIARPLIEGIWQECLSRSPDTIYGTMVCNHIYTQYAGRQHGTRPAALDLDGFTNFEGGQAIETSLLFLFRVLNRAARTIHLPARYAPIARELHGGLQLERTIVSEIHVPAHPATTLQARTLSRSLRLTVSTIGTDIREAVAAAMAEARDCRAVQVSLPADQPAAPWAADRLRESGFYFCGVLPLWGDSDHLVLQRTLRPPDWSKVSLCDALAKRLLAFIREDHAAVGGA